MGDRKVNFVKCFIIGIFGLKLCNYEKNRTFIYFRFIAYI